MLIPRFTIRWSLALTTVMAVFFIALRNARAGETWALAIVAFSALALVVFLIYGLGFLCSYFASRFVNDFFPKQENQNPFVVEGQFPPQVVPKNPVRDQE